MLKTRIEGLKDYINNEIEERGLKNNQIEIDFAGLGEYEEITEASRQLGFDIVESEGQGVYWLYTED